MLWIILTLATIFIWSIVNIYDKHFVEKEIREPYIDTAVFSFAQFLCLIVFGLVTIKNFNPQYFGLSLAAGAIYFVATYFYYLAMKNEQVSTLAPILVVEPAVVVVLAYVFLRENLFFYQYLAIAAIIAGAWIISWQKVGKFSLLHGFSFLAMFAFASRNIFIKMGELSGLPFPAICLGIGLGGFLSLLISLLFSHSHFEKHEGRSIRKLLAVSVFSALGFLFYSKAITLGPVSLVAALLATKPILVFIFSYLLSKIKPDFLSEKMTKKVLLRKLAAIILIVAGGIGLIF